MDYRTRITVEPGKRSGKPCVRGLRITCPGCTAIIGYGIDPEEYCMDLPDVGERRHLCVSGLRGKPCAARGTACLIEASASQFGSASETVQPLPFEDLAAHPNFQPVDSHALSKNVVNLILILPLTNSVIRMPQFSY